MAKMFEIFAHMFSGKQKAHASEQEGAAIEETLEERINRMLASEREKIRPTTQDIERFGWVTGDNNPVHRLESRAKKLGFENTPLMGAHIAAYGEQFAELALKTIRDYFEIDVKITGQKTKFIAPIYPQENMWWQIQNVQQKGEDLILDITGEVRGKKDRAKVIELTSRLSSNYPQMPQIAGPIYSRPYLRGIDHLEEFYKSLGVPYTERIPHALPAAFVPATLLELLENKAHIMEGANLSMDFDFLNDAKLGMMQVDIFPPQRPPREKKTKNPQTNEYHIEGYIYQFRAVVSQNTQPVAYGEIMSFAPKKIDLNI